MGDGVSMKQIRVKDLADQFDMPHPRPCLHCASCGNSYSAHKGDYFMADQEHVFRCCGRPMQLGVRRVVFTAQ